MKPSDKSIELFHGRLKHAVIIYDEIFKYGKCILEFMERHSQEHFDFYMSSKELLDKAVANVSSTIEKMPGVPVDTFVRYCLDIYEDFNFIDITIEKLTTIINDTHYIESLMYNMSQTFSRESTTTRKYIADLTVTYHSKYTFVDKTIEDLYNIININDVLTTVSPIILNANVVTPFLVYIISKTIADMPLNNQTRIYSKKFVNRADELKFTSLAPDESSQRIIKVPPGLPTVQQLTTRHGLFPVSPYMTIDELFDTFKCKYDFNIGVNENFEIAAKTHPISILHKSSNKVIEFNILPLIDATYVRDNKLDTGPKSGLNNRIIRRFNTVKSIPRITTKSKINLNMIMRYGDSDEPTMIIECINAKHYKILSTNFDNKLVDADVVKNMIAGISTVPHYYNKIMSKLILDNAINKKHRALMIEFESTKSVAFSIVNKLLKEQLMETFDRLYENEKPGTADDIWTFIADESTVKMAVDIMLKIVSDELFTYSRLTKKMEKTLEIKLSFVSVMHKIATKYHDEYIASCERILTPHVLQKVETITDMKNFVLGWVTDVIDATNPCLDIEPNSLDDTELMLKEFAIKFPMR